MTDILVGVDGSPASIGALTIAGGLAAHFGGRLVVALAVEPEPGAARPGDGRPAAIDRWCEEAVLSHPHEPAVLVGEPAATLAEAAGELGAGLVVVGTEGTLGRQGPRLGSVANSLAHRLDVPFLAVPVGCRWRGVHEVVVGVDGSEGAVAAVAFLAGLPAVDQATVSVVFDCHPLTGWSRAEVPDELRRRAEHDIGLWAAPLVDAGAPVRTVVVEEGHPSLTLLAAADEVHAELVVAGMQATNRLTQRRAGSTAFQLLHRATRPTLLVPPPPVG